MVDPQDHRWLQFYRYLTPDEAFAVDAAQLVTTLRVGGLTYYSPDRYLTRLEALQKLAMPRTPVHRLGPFPEDELPQWTINLQPVAPNFGQPGGGWEVATTGIHYTPRSVPLG